MVKETDLNLQQRQVSSAADIKNCFKYILPYVTSWVKGGSKLQIGVYNFNFYLSNFNCIEYHCYDFLSPEPVLCKVERLLNVFVCFNNI